MSRKSHTTHKETISKRAAARVAYAHDIAGCGRLHAAVCFAEVSK